MCIIHEVYWRGGEFADSDIERCSAFYENSMCANQFVDCRTLSQPSKGQPATSQEKRAIIRAGFKDEWLVFVHYPWLFEKEWDSLADVPEALARGQKGWGKRSVRSAAVGEKKKKKAEAGKNGSWKESGETAFGEQGERSVQRWREKEAKGLLTPPKSPRW